MSVVDDETAMADGGSGLSRDRSQRPKKRAVWWIVALVALLAIGGAAAFIVPKFFGGTNAGVSIPSGFPAADVLPLVEGDVVSASSADAIPLTVVKSVASHEAQLAALEMLKSAGYVVIGESGSGPNGAVYSMSGNGVTVRVEFTHTEADGFQVKYTTASNSTPKETNGS